MSSPSFRLETLGTVVLKGSGLAIRAADQRQQRRRLALLAALASAGERGMSRDQLLLLFWPDSTQKKARHSLDQLLYAIRTSLGEAIFAGTNPVRLNPEFITADICDFKRNISEQNFELAVAGYGGPFLDGFYLSDTREFEEWAESERQRLAFSYETALEQLALDAERNADHTREVHWRRKLSEADPLSSRHALALMTALANTGDMTAAIAYGERYQRDAAETIGASGTSGVREMISQLRELQVTPDVTHLRAPQPHESFEPAPVRRYRAPLYIAAAAVSLIGLGATMLTGSGAQSVGRDGRPVGTSNVAAYDLYVRGKDQVVMRNDSTARLALEFFRQAAALDSGFAAAHAGIAMMYTRLAMSNAPGIPRPDLRQRAIDAARKAIALNDSLAEAHATLGLINAYWLIDLNTAQTHLEQAVALDPKDPQAREYLALVYMYIGRRSDALREMRLAVAHNPLSPAARAMLAANQYMVGRCDLALPALDSLAAMNPPLLRVAVTRSLCHASRSEWVQAIAAVRHPAEAGGVRSMGVLGFALARSGQRAEATVLRTKLREIARTNPAAWFDASVISFGLREMDTTFEELQRSVDAGVLPWELLGPVFEDLRADPRFARLAASKGLREPAPVLTTAATQ